MRNPTTTIQDIIQDRLLESEIKKQYSAIVFIQFENQRNFSAVGEFVAFDAFRPYLMRQGFFLYPAEPAFLKELRHIRKDEHLCDAQFTRLPYAYPHQFPADSFSLSGFHHSN